MTIPRFQKTILNWYKTNRRDMPWRNTKDPYKILVSEIMLQQTQVSRVLPKYQEFLKAFPTLVSLARARDKRLLRVWQGLGYWRRAKYLKETAQTVFKNFKGKFPRDPNTLETLPGIGHYTARALACFSAQGGPASGGASCEAFLDTNIRRVYLHFFFKDKKDVSNKEILKIAQKAVRQLAEEKISPREWHYALFDYGALVLKDKTLNKKSRHYHKQSKFEGSFRSFRTKIIKLLLLEKDNKMSQNALKNFIKQELQKEKSCYSSEKIISSLLKDKLLKKASRYYSL